MNKKTYEIGSGNVFKYLGVPNAEEHLIKAQLVYKIDKLMKARNLKQAEAAELFGVRQPDAQRCHGFPQGLKPGGLWVWVARLKSCPSRLRVYVADF